MAIKYSKIYQWQRKTALCLVFLVPWFLLKAFGLRGLTYGETLAEFHSPLTAGLTALLLLCGLCHGYIGLNVICTDYVRKKTREPILGVLAALFGLCAVIGCFCLIRIVTKG